VAFSFIGGGNRRKPPTYHKPLTNFITECSIDYISLSLFFFLLLLIVFNGFFFYVNFEDVKTMSPYHELSETVCFKWTILNATNRMKNKTYHTVRTILKSNTKIVERGKICTANTEIHALSLSLLGTGTSVKQKIIRDIRDTSVNC
jgi:hypothetical protein